MCTDHHGIASVGRTCQDSGPCLPPLFVQVIITGTDIPDVSGRLFAAAARALDHHDVSTGPVPSGGEDRRRGLWAQWLTWDRCEDRARPVVSEAVGWSVQRPQSCFPAQCWSARWETGHRHRACGHGPLV